MLSSRPIDQAEAQDARIRKPYSEVYTDRNEEAGHIATQQAVSRPWHTPRDPHGAGQCGLNGGIAGEFSHPAQPDPREVPVVLQNLEAAIEDLMKSVAQLENRLYPVLLQQPEQPGKEQSRVMGCDLAGRLSSVALAVGRVTVWLDTIEARVQL